MTMTETLERAQRKVQRKADLTKVIRRYLRLADIVDLVPPKNFDMRHWLEFDDPQDGRTWTPADLNDLTDKSAIRVANTPAEFLAGMRPDLTNEQLSCGTSACVAGWALFTWAKEVKGESIEEAAKRILMDEVWPVGNLFEAGADWETPDHAAYELRRRANLMMAELTGLSYSRDFGYDEDLDEDTDDDDDGY